MNPPTRTLASRSISSIAIMLGPLTFPSRSASVAVFTFMLAVHSTERSHMARTRTLPGKAISWTEFLALPLAGRDLRILSITPGEKGEPRHETVTRAPIAGQQQRIHEGRLIFPVSWSAYMRLDGPLGGIWLKARRQSFVQC